MGRMCLSGIKVISAYVISSMCQTFIKDVLLYLLVCTFFQGLPIPQWEHIEETSGSWETVFIPVPSPSPQFSVKAAYTLRNLPANAVYDIVAKAKNKFGWSQLSKVFNFFNKGVGMYCLNIISLAPHAIGAFVVKNTDSAVTSD